MSSSSLGSSSSAGSSSSSSSPGPCGLTLHRSAQTLFNGNSIQGFRFTVHATAECFASEIFRYRRRPYNPTTGEEADEFDGICSAVDLEELPVGAPDPNRLPPYFRTADIDLVFRSQLEAEEAWVLIQADARALVRTLGAMSRLAPAETVTFPEE